MVAKAKLYARLDDLETELVERLIPHLQRAIGGNNDLVFCVKGYHKFDSFKSPSDPVTSELVDIGAQILSLRQKLNESSEGSVAERICWYCREWGDVSNHHRPSAPLLAAQFLAEIQQRHQ